MNHSAAFDALVSFSDPLQPEVFAVSLVFPASSPPASFHYYAPRGTVPGHFFVQARLNAPLAVKWMDSFEIMDPGGKTRLGWGVVLNPVSADPKRVKLKKLIPFLTGLAGTEKDMLRAFIAEKGVQGAQEKDISDFCRLTAKRLETLSRELEEESQVRILSFSPLFLVSRSGLEFLGDKIADFVALFHGKHPETRGIPLEKIQARFNAHPKIISLTVKHLERDGKLRISNGIASLPDFEIPLTTEDEEILGKMETMLLRGKLGTVSLGEIQMEFRLSSEKLDGLLSLLIERKKIVQSQDGFFLHSRWVDDVVRKLRESGKRRLTVADFKEMTGLTRKYAIPLLELLDSMGVTRRKGSVREIL